MPPKPKITREMVIDAAFQIARESGWEQINARSVAKRLNCSTQPVMYYFATMEALKRAVYEKADLAHGEFLMDLRDDEDVMLGIGMNYIRYAIQEPNLFRFLLQSGYTKENTLLEMVDSQELLPVLLAMQQGMGLSLTRAKDVFLMLFLFAHGYASIIANNSLTYDEKKAEEYLERAYCGVMAAAQEESHEETI